MQVRLAGGVLGHSSALFLDRAHDSLSLLGGKAVLAYFSIWGTF